MDDSGVSGVSGCGEDDAEYGGAPACTGTGGGMGFGGEVDGGCCDLDAKVGMGVGTPEEVQRDCGTRIARSAGACSRRRARAGTWVSATRLTTVRSTAVAATCTQR